ncbi:uncharacterized protein BDR25DRAFT_361891 [Lindgomyces ingoldianus]|uniref:Uncharacterized protein n=1 Tax=Lindgomyces ingoldianus TaxID=673940 RepID=A0ACB6QDD1_9PLEO|nr:uncharacterized protein BDR25DRAFT_361891 [Lindgomyces ingoldianus]KAF2464150.1 hypothetical protein BDR25DRAFT_361891 [Lindgomyces ingoldianus]
MLSGQPWNEETEVKTGSPQQSDSRVHYERSILFGLHLFVGGTALLEIHNMLLAYHPSNAEQDSAAFWPCRNMCGVPLNLDSVECMCTASSNSYQNSLGGFGAGLLWVEPSFTALSCGHENSFHFKTPLVSIFVATNIAAIQLNTSSYAVHGALSGHHLLLPNLVILEDWKPLRELVNLDSRELHEATLCRLPFSNLNSIEVLVSFSYHPQSQNVLHELRRGHMVSERDPGSNPHYLNEQAWNPFMLK